MRDLDVVQAPAFVAESLQPAVGEAHDGGGSAGGKVQRDVAVHRVEVTGEAEVAGALVDHPHVAGGGEVGHQHLQPCAVGVDGERRDRGHAGVAAVVAGVEQHAGAGAEVAADQLDHLADIGRGLRRVGGDAVGDTGDDLGQRGGGHRRAVQRRVDAVHLALGRRHVELAAGAEGQAGDLGLVEALGAGVDPPHLGERAGAGALQFQQLRPAVDRAQPEMPGRRVDRQPGPALHVDRRHPRPQLRAGGGVELDDAGAGAAVLGDEQMPGGRVVHARREVVVGAQHDAGEDRAVGGVDRQHAVAVRVAVEHQQRPGRDGHAAQAHRRGQQLQPRVVVQVGGAVAVVQRQRLLDRAGGGVEPQQVAGAGVVAHPQRPARRVGGDVAEGGAVHRHAQGVEGQRRGGAARRGGGDAAEAVGGQRGAVEGGPAVLGAVVGVVVDVDVAVARRVGRGGPGEGVGGGPFDEAAAVQHGVAGDVEAAQRGHDLQHGLAGRPEHPQRGGAVGVGRDDQRGAAAVGGGRRGVQDRGLGGAVGVGPAQQHVGGRGQARAGQRDGLAGVGRGQGGVGGGAGQRGGGDAGQAGGVGGAGAAGGLGGDRPERAVQRHGDGDAAAVDVLAERGVVAVADVRPAVDARVEHGLRAEAVLAAVALDEAQPGQRHRRRRPVRGHRLHVHPRHDWDDLEVESAICREGLGTAHLREQDRIACHRVKRHGKVGHATGRIVAAHLDIAGTLVAVVVNHLETHPCRGWVETNR